MRALLSTLVLAVSLTGCGPEEPFPQPSNRMDRARPAPPEAPQPSPSSGGIMAENCRIEAPLGELLQPAGQGPLRLVAIKCSNPVVASGRNNANLVSPDGSRVALLGGWPEKRLTFQMITGGENVTVPVPTPQVDFTTMSGGIKKAILALAIGLDLGALAVFKYYSFFAQDVADALNSVSLGMPLPLLTIRDMAVTTLPDGRLRAALAERDLVFWTQGERPRRFANAFEGARTPLMRFTPDGAGLLAVRPLQTVGGTSCRHAGMGCGPGRPVEGVLAALHDVRTGAVRWRIRARVISDEGFPMPAISPDGRFALIGLPRTEGAGRRLALVRMTDGRIVQELPAPPLTKY